MKVKLYVNWQDERIIKEKAYEEEILESVKEREEEDDYEFSEFLEDYLNRNRYGCKLAYLFNMSKEEREKVLKLWKEDCFEVVRANFAEDYEEIEIEL